MRVLITGGAGFVGANLAMHLRQHNCEVVAMDNLVRRGSERNVRRLAAAGVEFVHGDCRSVDDVPDEDFDAVCHTAAQPSAVQGYRAPNYEMNNNVAGLFPILNLCRRCVATLVFWSSNKVYPCAEVERIEHYETPTAILLRDPVDEHLPLNGNDRSLYGATKLAGETLAREWGRSFGFPVYVNRFSCLAGPWQWGKTEQGWVAWWVLAHHFGLPLKYIGFHGKQTRDVLHVGDVCSLVAKQLVEGQDGNEGGLFNVGGGMSNVCSLIEATEICRTIIGKETSIEEVSEPRPADFRAYVSDIRRVCDRFDWKPTMSPLGVIGDIYDWVRCFEEDLKSLYLVEKAL